MTFASDIAKRLRLKRVTRDSSGKLLRRYHEVKQGPTGALYYEIRKRDGKGNVKTRRKYLSKRLAHRCLSGDLRSYRGGVCK